jgi:hypothetical protein
MNLAVLTDPELALSWERLLELYIAALDDGRPQEGVEAHEALREVNAEIRRPARGRADGTLFEDGQAHERSA